MVVLPLRGRWRSSTRSGSASSRVRSVASPACLLCGGGTFATKGYQKAREKRAITLRLLAGSARGDPASPTLLRLPPGAVACLVAVQLAVAHLDRLVRDAVEEVAVVGYEDDRTGEVLQLPLEDLERVYVQVVRWLVQDQAVGLPEHQKEELQARALAPAQISHRLPHLLVAKEKAAEQVDRLALVEWLRVPHQAEGRRARRRLGVLGEVSDPYGGSHPALTLRRREDACEELRQDALPCAVGPDHTDPLAARDREVHADENRLLAEGHARLAKLQHLLAAPDVLAESEPDLVPFQDRAVHLLHALDLALLDPGLAGVSLVLRVLSPLLEAPDRLFQPRYLLLLGDVELLLALEHELPRERVGRVVAGPRLRLPAIQLGDLRDGLVKQVAVVGDDDDGSVEAPDQTLQPLSARRIQVGLWLVQQQDVGAPNEAGRECDEFALPAAEIRRRPVRIIPIHTQRPQVTTRLALEALPAQLGEALQ